MTDVNLAFSEAAKSGDYATIVKLCTNNHTDLNVNWPHPAYFQNTSLMRAARHGHDDIVFWLLEHTDANVNEKNMYGQTALIEAACNGHGNVIVTLLEYGARIDERDKDGDTALIYAAKWGEENALRVLLDHGASIDVQGSQGMNALAWAKFKNRGGCVGILSSHVSTPYARNKVDLWNRVSSHERQKYLEYWIEADRNKDGKVDTEEARDWFKKAKISNNTINQIWRLASNSRKHLDQYSFGLAMRYIALAQENRPLAREDVMDLRQKLLPCFVFLVPEAPIPGEMTTSVGSNNASSEFRPMLSLSNSLTLSDSSLHEASNPVETWKVDDVCSLFSSLGADAVDTDNLKKARIDGEALLSTTEDELKRELNLPLGVIKKYNKWLARQRGESTPILSSLVRHPGDESLLSNPTSVTSRSGISTPNSVPNSQSIQSPALMRFSLTTRLDLYPIDRWACEDVLALFKRLGAEPHDLERLRDARINGLALLELNDEDLKNELGLPLGVRKAFKHWLDKRRSKASLEDHVLLRLKDESKVNEIVGALEGIGVTSFEGLLELLFSSRSVGALQELERQYPGLMPGLQPA